MRRFYQESWQGIPFSAFTHVSFYNLAGSEFYATFYEELFRRYTGWESLPADWRLSKDKGAKWLAGQIEAQREHWEHEDLPEAPPRVLSIGSGLGYMEKSLIDVMPNMELHVNEPSTVGLRWLRNSVPSKRIYIGSPHLCLPADITYTVIYLSAIDYSMNNHDFEFTLREIRAQLAPGGRLICISASLLEEDSLAGTMVNAFKIGLRFVLHLLDVRRQQLWGWRRTREEYHQIFTAAGFRNIQDGWLDDGFNSYWISGE